MKSFRSEIKKERLQEMKMMLQLKRGTGKNVKFSSSLSGYNALNFIKRPTARGESTVLKTDGRNNNEAGERNKS